MKRLPIPSLVITSLALLGFPGPRPLWAEPEAVKRPSPTNRYLLIVNTSHSMGPRAEGSLRAVQQLLESAMNGQLRRGDTLGVWTFNQELYMGRFPLQHWSPGDRRGVTLRTLAFLQKQKYERRASFDKVLPAMDSLVKDSEFITVILVTDGDEPIQGTPFDDQINLLYKQWRDEQQKARQPLLTLLRAKDGRLTDYSVNTPPWPLELPPLPPELQNTQSAKVEPPKAPQKVQPLFAPPLILSGRKPATTQTTGPADLSAGKSEPHATVAPSEAAKSDAVAAQSGASEKVEKAKPEPSGIAASTPSSEAGAANTNEPVHVEPAKLLSPPAEVARLQPSPGAPALVSKPDLTAPETSKPTATTSTDQSATGGTTAAAPVLSQATSVVLAEPAPDTPIPQPRAQGAVAIASQTPINHKVLWVAGLFLLAVALVAAGLLARRSRLTPHASLITRSLDREKKS